ncbi:MAG: arylsulfatase, partial [Bacteroidota bacterium]
MRIIALLSVLFLLFSCQQTTEQAATIQRSDKPNIIYIMADDLGYGDLSAYGQEKFETPNIDQMLAEGMKFTRHYAGSTVCAPSRSSLMTGEHTGHTFVRGNKEVKPEGQHPLADSVLTVAEILKAAGYKTGAIGKWGLGAPGSEGEPNAQGFDFFYGYNCQREAHSYYPDHLWRNRERVELPANTEGKTGTFSQDLMMEETIKYLEENKNDPFFLYLPYTIPHASIEVPEQDLKPFLGKYEEVAFEGGHYRATENPRATFAAMIARLDQDVGKVLKTLKRLGIAENTLVVFTSDNGAHQEGGADPAFFNSSGGLRGLKRDLYEGGVRVPMIAWWPGTVQAGSSTEHISAFWDFLPTACDIAGASVPDLTDGISYLQTLKGRQQPEHGFLYWEFHEQGGKQAVLMDPWKGVRLGVNQNPKAPIELYNLQEDPSEQNNIAAQHPDIVAQIEEIIEVSHEKNPYSCSQGKLKTGF